MPAGWNENVREHRYLLLVKSYSSFKANLVPFSLKLSSLTKGHDFISNIKNQPAVLWVI
jgi:hypothetical protein